LLLGVVAFAAFFLFCFESHFYLQAVVIH
jgi:hypothetical protein